MNKSRLGKWGQTLLERRHVPVQQHGHLETHADRGDRVWEAAACIHGVSFPPGAVWSSTPLDPTHCSHPGQLWLSQRAGGLQEVFRPKHEAPGLDRYWWETSGQCTKRQTLPLPPGSGCQCPWAALTWCCHTACCSLVSLQCCPHPEGCHPSQAWGQVAPGNSCAAANPSHITGPERLSSLDAVGWGLGGKEGTTRPWWPHSHPSPLHPRRKLSVGLYWL